LQTPTIVILDEPRGHDPESTLLLSIKKIDSGSLAPRASGMTCF
jgi:hypothetical protein